MAYNRVVKFAVSIGLCEGIGMAGGFFSAQSVPSWYNTLCKPSFTPPSSIFAPVWTLLYALMGIAAALIYERKVQGRGVALFVFGIQLVLNFLWSVLFFSMRSPFSALVEIVILWFTIVVTAFLFWRISKKAALLLIPYLLWVSFASVLNLEIWRLNR
jgi:tryptophan-rich sensory protein